MPCWFFMSYARADDQQRDTELVSEFFRDLEAQVAAGVTDQTPPLGYIDHHELQPGDPWPDDLAAAVRNARTFLAVMTARYFTRPYCGSEWGIFEDRCRALGHEVRAPLIIPLLWVRPHEGELPSFATDLQITFDQDLVPPEERPRLADYATYGLQHIMKRRAGSHQTVYETIIEQLARRIVSVAHAHPLPPLAGTGLPSLRDAPNRFASLAAVAPATASASNQAHFVFVAGTAQEMGGLRPEPQRYYGIRPTRPSPSPLSHRRSLRNDSSS
jgi:TIR domain